MAENSRGLLFRKRNILGAALVAGIGLGVYLGQFKGLFFGSGSNFGIGTSDGQKQSSTESSNGSSDDSKTVATTESPDEIKSDLPTVIPDVVKVLIDERQFLLRQPTGDTPIALSKLMQIVKQAPGDSDGFRVRIYEKASARPSAEEKLKEALVESEIPDSAVLWVPTPVKDTETRKTEK